MTGGPEFTDVEQPFLDQLASMGRKTLTGSVDAPLLTGRVTFRTRPGYRPSAKAAQ